MDGLDDQISRFSQRIRMGLFALLGVITIATLATLILDKGTVWLGIDGINLGVISGEDEIPLEDEASQGETTAEEEEETEQELLLDELEERFEWVGLLLFLMTVTFYGLLVFQIERLFAAYQRGEIFSPENARRIRNIGLLFCMAAAVAVLDSLTELYIMQEFVAVTTDIEPGDDWELVREIRLPLPFLLCGIAIVLIARVMEKGARLQDEMDHLI